VTERAAQRLQWARRVLDDPALELVSASSDASFRSYWRTVDRLPSRIVMDAPPAQEHLGPWLDVAARLQHAGLHAPQVLAQDLEQGFLLLSDLGTQLLLPALDEARVDALYGLGLDALQAMQTRIATDGLPDYDRARLLAEMELLPAWFIERHLGIALDAAQRQVLDDSFATLADNALAQPQVFVHRDFHSRNLMLDTGDDGTPRLGIIDFQDAVRGPLTYDLVSLLRDCYIEWPDARVQAWAEAYRQRARSAGLCEAAPAEFARWFDLMGLQRHIKVLGIFCRLWYRDGKRVYLADLPLVWRYARDVGMRHPETRAVVELLDRLLGTRDIRQPRP
jgi:N-acetylmuramate 1-kinase